jgi:hypothetical protein
VLIEAGRDGASVADVAGLLRQADAVPELAWEQVHDRLHELWPHLAREAGLTGSNLIPSSEPTADAAGSSVDLILALVGCVKEQASIGEAILAHLSRQEQERPTNSPAEQFDPECQAISLLFNDPPLTVEQIAKRLGKSRTALYRWPKFQHIAEAKGLIRPRKGSRDCDVPRGSKSKGGDLEAWRDEN